MKRTDRFFIGILLLQLALMGCKEEVDPPAPPTVPVVAGPDLSHLSDSQRTLVMGLNELTTGISQFPLDIPDDQLAGLGEAIGNVRIAGFGEASHGSSEFFAMKDRVFRYLVEQHGYRTFAIEADMAICVMIDRHLRTGAGNLDSLVFNTTWYGVWRTTEVLSLLEWIRSYNTGKNADQQIHFMGFDCQSTRFQPQLLREFLLPYDAGFAHETDSILQRAHQLAWAAFGGSASYADIVQSDRDLNELLERMDQEKSALIQMSSETDFIIHRRLIANVIQALTVSAGGGTGYYTHRDKFMARNLAWYEAELAPAGGIFAWAHNLHLGLDYNGIIILNSIGARLRDLYNDNFVSVGFGFSTGSFLANYREVGADSGQWQPILMPPLPPENSTNYLFHHATDSNFMVDMKALQVQAAWESYLASPRTFFQPGAVFYGNFDTYYYELPLNYYFDWLIYFRNTTATERL